jgi:hypothetical protein
MYCLCRDIIELPPCSNTKKIKVVFIYFCCFEGWTAGGPCVPQRWRLARGRNTQSSSHETPVHAKIFTPKYTPPTGNTKNYKIWHPTQLRGPRVPGPATWPLCMDFLSLLCKQNSFDLCLHSCFWFLSKCRMRTLTTENSSNHLVTSSSSEVVPNWSGLPRKWPCSSDTLVESAL